MSATFHILGAGYCASRFFSLHPKRCVVYTRKNVTPIDLDAELRLKNWNPEEILNSRKAASIFLDEIKNYTSSTAVSTCLNVVLITFPLSKLSQTHWDTFLNAVELHQNSQLKFIVLGSWGSLDVQHLINPLQNSHFKPDDLRNERELRLVKAGASRLLLAGIHGPNRNPMTWLKKGLISLKKVSVNLIHVDDIISLCLHLAKRADNSKLEFGIDYILCDGKLHLWTDIESKAHELKIIDDQFQRNNIPIKRPDRDVDFEAFKVYFDNLDWSPSQFHYL